MHWRPHNYEPRPPVVQQNPEEKDQAYKVYRAAKQALPLAILDASGRSWDELLEGPDRRPYRMVLCKLRSWMPLLTETLDLERLRRVIDSLEPTSLGYREGV